MDTVDEIRYPYQGCVQGKDVIHWERPYGDVVNSFIGAEDCALKCLNGGYKYWGLECPREIIHCQCGLDGILDSAMFLDDQKCKEYNRNDSATHCVGPFESS